MSPLLVINSVSPTKAFSADNNKNVKLKVNDFQSSPSWRLCVEALDQSFIPPELSSIGDPVACINCVDR